MFEQAKPYLALAGRILLGLIFLLSGVTKIFNWDKTAEMMAGQGMVAVPVFLFLAILVDEQEHQIDLATALGKDVPDVTRPEQRA